MNTKGEKYIKKENKKAKSKSKYKEKNNTYHTKKKNRQLSLEKDTTTKFALLRFCSKCSFCFKGALVDSISF